jgi:hypothetical protein
MPERKIADYAKWVGVVIVDETKLESDLANIVATVNSILSTMETHGLVAAA